MSLVETFCSVDDFCQLFEPRWERMHLKSGLRQRRRRARLSLSEVMTIIIHFHQSGYRTFKSYYQNYVLVHLQGEFPTLVSYSRFVRLMKRAVVPLLFYLRVNQGSCTGISFVDSTPIRVCHNRRIQRHKTFKDLAARGRTSMGWFYGFKLHLVVNEHGEILAFQLTPGNVDDRKPVPFLSKSLFGKLFADRGYISQDLFAKLFQEDIQLITGLRKNMQNRLMPWVDKLLLRKRAIIETINDQLKNISQIEHSRHRSFVNFFVNLLAGLSAYCLQSKKPSLHIHNASPATIH
jgi:transposase